MNAVGRLGSYISRSVYVVSGPFHPFGGAVDIIVVEQPDGSFKSSPWYVRFGKFQGVLKATDKIVSVIVNGVEADFHMYLDNKGEAHFIREVDVEGGISPVSCPLSSSGEEDIEGQSHSRRPMKSKSCNFDGHQSDSVAQIDVGPILGRTNSRRSRILGFVMGRGSRGENSSLEGKNESGFVTKESLESAEMAADLLEAKWSRSMVSSRRKKDGVAQLTTQDLSTGAQTDADSVKHETVVDTSVNSSPLQQDDSSNYEKDHLSCSIPTESTETANEAGVTITCLVSTYVAGASPVEGNEKSISQILCENEELCVRDKGEVMNSVDTKFEAFSREQFVLGDGQIGSTSMNTTCGKINEKNLECDGVPLYQVENEFIAEPFSERVSFQPLHGSVETTESHGTLNRNCVPLLEQTMSEIGKMYEPVFPLDTVDYPVRPCLHGSENSEELFFGELDDMRGIDPIQGEEAIPQHHEGESEILVSKIRSEESNESSIGNNVPELPAEGFGSKDSSVSAADIDIQLKILPRDLNNHDKAHSQVEEVSMTARSLPIMSVLDSGLNSCRVGQPSECAPDSDNASFEQARLPDDALRERESEADNGSEGLNTGTSSLPFDASPTSWKSLSFPSNRSRRNSDAQHVSKREDGFNDEREVPKLKATKISIRTTTPTTEELKSLKLKEGTNTIEFTFSTPMLGKQQVEARIHLWKWDSRIVISDVDGTITRSDVLGQVMPLVGVDWSQTGVAHLFSAIKENGYHVLFLSARAISQAYSTRQFLSNLKQDGKALPEGPIVISPDGLFPSLYREVVRRAPHEFKISCLEAIKALFPSDRNPFYAGFGNRDTDEISYLKVGIPKGKIFIINPKGEIVVNRRVDRKSYTSLHALVNDMFPLMSSSEQEDFNSWNYWKLPIPNTDI